jgi:hypothetical protein
LVDDADGAVEVRASVSLTLSIATVDRRPVNRFVNRFDNGGAHLHGAVNLNDHVGDLGPALDARPSPRIP